ncbi:MAG: hypothetical protein WBG38_07375 [Nodosilinea sp.]
MVKDTRLSKTLALLGLFLVVATTACTKPTPAPTSGTTDSEMVSPEAEEAMLVLTGEGLRFVVSQTGSTVPIDFSSDMAFATDTVSEVLGEPESTATNTECPAGPLTSNSWSNGLTLTAADGQFVGWGVSSAEGAAELTTATGIGIGSTLADLESAYKVELPDSTLGVEFYTGELSGLLSKTAPDGVITDMWAGTVCNFR